MPTPTLTPPRTASNPTPKPSADLLKQTFSIDDEGMFDTNDPTEKGPDNTIKSSEELGTKVPDKEAVVNKPGVTNEEQVKVEAAKPEAAKPAKPAEPAKGTEPSSVLKPFIDKKSKPTERDYTGFSDEEVRALKGMSNEAFAYVAPKLKETKQLEKLKDATYLQHPQAYTLHPEFQRLQGESSWAEYEGQAWQQQLISIKQTGKFQPILGVKDGQIQYGPEQDADAMDEERARQNLNVCVQKGQQVQQQLQQAPHMFKQAVDADMKLIEEVRKQRFDWIRDPELLKFELEIEGAGSKPISEHRQNFVKMWPIYQQNTPGVQVAADLWIAMHSYAMQLKQALAGNKVASTLEDEGKNVEVTSQVKPGKKSEGRWGVKTFDLSGMPE